jgi:hypothetical protein
MLECIENGKTTGCAVAAACKILWINGTFKPLFVFSPQKPQP